VLTAGDAVIAHVVGIKEEVVATPEVAAVAEPEVAVKKGKKDEAAPAAAPEKGKKK
jgi:hypothetical protein